MLSSVCYYFSCFVSIVLSDQLIIVMTWVNLMGWAGRGQCTDLASWLLNKMYMLLLAVICYLSILISCYCLALVDHIIMPIFPFHFTPPPFPRLLKFFIEYETSATLFSQYRLLSSTSNVVSQSGYRWTDSRNHGHSEP